MAVQKKGNENSSLSCGTHLQRIVEIFLRPLPWFVMQARQGTFFLCYIKGCFVDNLEILFEIYLKLLLIDPLFLNLLLHFLHIVLAIHHFHCTQFFCYLPSYT